MNKNKSKDYVDEDSMFTKNLETEYDAEKVVLDDESEIGTGNNTIDEGAVAAEKEAAEEAAEAKLAAKAKSEAVAAAKSAAEKEAGEKAEELAAEAKLEAVAAAKSAAAEEAEEDSDAKSEAAAAAKSKADKEKSGKNNKNNNSNNDTSLNSGKWNRDEKELLDQSLMENGNATSYEHIMTFVKTRTRKSIKSYYLKNKRVLLRRRNVNVSRKEKNLEGIRNRESEDEDLVAEKVGVVGRVDSIVIIDEVIETETREQNNASVYLASNVGLTEFVQSYFALIKEKVETENKHVVVPNVGTFYRNENGQMAVTHHPYPASKKHEEVS